MHSGVPEFSDDMRHKEIHLVHWFRKGLRLHDNPALKTALIGATTCRCVYIIDTWFASNRVGIVKWRFLLQCLHDLDTRLRRLNSRLFIVRGQPASVFPKIFQQWKVNRLSFEVDPEPYAKQRDAVICTLAEKHGLEVIAKSSHTLYDLKEFLQRNYGVAPLTYKKFQIYLQKLNLPDRPVETVGEDDVRGIISSVSPDHDEVFQIPTLQELGFPKDASEKVMWQGGETEALLRFDRHLERKAWVASFEMPKMSVNCLMAKSTSISPYLRFGCLSSRLFFWRVTELYRSLNKRVDCPMSLHGQLLWREFFYLQATNNPKFDCMKGNPVCVQVPWDNNPEAVAKWREGQTGFPWIDAVMAQLRQEGWIHHIAWHSVACFLTHGCLWASWEEGMKAFDELCLDADWSFNAGMWQWLSFSSFFQKFYRSYCPATFGQRIDPNGDYIRKYVPILDGYPNAYIFKPWTAPKDVQVAAKCVVGKDYPRPMVSHKQARSTNLERMKQVYRHLLSKGGPLRKYARKQLCVMIEQMEEAGTE